MNNTLAMVDVKSLAKMLIETYGTTTVRQGSGYASYLRKQHHVSTELLNQTRRLGANCPELIEEIAGFAIYGKNTGEYPHLESHESVLTGLELLVSIDASPEKIADAITLPFSQENENQVYNSLSYFTDSLIPLNKLLKEKYPDINKRIYSKLTDILTAQKFEIEVNSIDYKKIAEECIFNSRKEIIQVINNKDFPYERKVHEIKESTNGGIMHGRSGLKDYLEGREKKYIGISSFLDVVEAELGEDVFREKVYLSTRELLKMKTEELKFIYQASLDNLDSLENDAFSKIEAQQPFYKKWFKK